MIDPRELGEVFRKAREAKGVTIEKANLQSRIHPNVIRDIESGDFTRLEKVYMRSFVKKYAVFLALNVNDILAAYDAVIKDRSVSSDPAKIEKAERVVAEKMVEQNLADSACPDVVKPQSHLKKKAPVLRNETKLTKSPIDLSINRKDAYIKIAFMLAVIVIAVIAGLAIRSRSVGNGNDKIKNENSAQERTPQQISKQPEVKKSKKNAAAAVEPKTKDATEKKSKASEADTVGDLAITLHATGEVWVQVFDANKKTIFVDTMAAGSSKSLKVSGEVSLWTGKGENMEVSVNGVNCGNIAKGVVRNIVISKKGIKIGSEWIKRFE
ncbi:MAG TPA: DUF4115 domain-containing protein [Candidatus Omnitrophota bacterium]|nr:DUF4115 domain-containing protein [Candidatus Omnitrophota bacterium]HPS20297.1 DUF4115 domain-containing protein [Candidatus Omnitrophota bacterium]